MVSLLTRLLFKSSFGWMQEIENHKPRWSSAHRRSWYVPRKGTKTELTNLSTFTLPTSWVYHAWRHLTPFDLRICKVHQLLKMFFEFSKCYKRTAKKYLQIKCIFWDKYAQLYSLDLHLGITWC